jgi:P2-related tail formation protein
MSNILASGISNVEHLKVFNQVPEERLAEIDLSVLLVYMIDTVPAEVLPILADQFDVLGYKGWRFVDPKGPYAFKPLATKALKNNALAGNLASTPNAAPNQILDDLEIIAYVKYENNGAFQTIVSKSIDPTIIAYYLGIDSLNRFEFQTAPSTAGIGASFTGWVRATRDKASGQMNFYKSTDSLDKPVGDIIWEKVGDTVTVGAGGSQSNVNTAVRIGTFGTGTTVPFQNEIFRVIVGDGANYRVDFNAASYVSGATLTGGYGETWTVAIGTPPGGIIEAEALKQVPLEEMILQQRELIKSAIELHRFKGTPWSIKEALRRIGFGGAQILEGVGQYHDATFYRNGTVTYSGANNWACFRVIFDLGNVKGINSAQTADLIALINEYKNARSRLVDLSFQKNIEDTATMVDEVAFKIVLPLASDSFTPYHDGEFRRNGIIQYSGYAEEVTINQLT